MSAPSEYLTHGTLPSTGVLQRQDITVRDDGFDDGYLVYVCPAIDTYQKGQAAPGFASMTIREVKSTLLPAADYELTMRVQGLTDGTSRRTNRGFTESLEGFDNGSETWLARYNAPPYDLGHRDASYQNMVLISAEREELPFGSPAWAKWNLRYMGTMGGKAYKRRISVDENIVSGSAVIVNLPNGWTDARKAQVSLPRVVVEDTQVVTSQPSFSQLPGRVTPPDPPTVQVIALNGADLTYHWPNGWKLAAMNFDPIVGTSIGIQTMRYEFVYEKTW